MSKSKYIIKNCPCLDNSGVCQRCKNWGVESCQDCTDCVIKQIVEKCKKMKQSAVTTALRVFATELLQLLDVQEVE